MFSFCTACTLNAHDCNLQPSNEKSIGIQSAQKTGFSILPDWPELNVKVINSVLMVYYNIGRDTLNDLFSLILVRNMCVFCGTTQN